MAVVSDLAKPTEEWQVGGVPFTAMMRVPPAVPGEAAWPRPTLYPQRVDIDGEAFRRWRKVRQGCAEDELYENPGPIQFSGPSASRVSWTISTKFSYIKELGKLRENLAAVSSRCRPGCDPRLVRVANQSLGTLS